MTTEIQRLESLGWKPLGEERQKDHWCVLAESCGHKIIVVADARDEAWVAACKMAMKLTREGLLRLPRL